MIKDILKNQVLAYLLENYPIHLTVLGILLVSGILGLVYVLRVKFRYIFPPLVSLLVGLVAGLTICDHYYPDPTKVEEFRAKIESQQEIIDVLKEKGRELLEESQNTQHALDLALEESNLEPAVKIKERVIYKYIKGKADTCESMMDVLIKYGGKHD